MKAEDTGKCWYIEHMDGTPCGKKVTKDDGSRCKLHQPQSPKTYCTITTGQLRGLLTRDLICRRTRSWHLLSAEEMEVMFHLTMEYRTLKFPPCPTHGLNPLTAAVIVSSGMGDFYTIDRSGPSPAAAPPLSEENKYWPSYETAAINTLKLHYPLIQELLDGFHGSLVVAGGAIFKALIIGAVANDIDLFFVDPDIERSDVSDDAKMEKATTTLISAISFLADLWLKGSTTGEGAREKKEGGAERTNPCVYVSRNEFVTTVHLFSNQTCVKYQFIHRVYPSIGSILGGFDLGPAMVAYDGQRILATELGAFSALGRILIVDISRRSTSFEHRLDKYSTYCHIVIPGLSRTAIDDRIKFWKSKDEVKPLLSDVIETAGYTWGIDNLEDLAFQTRTYTSSYSYGLVPRKPYATKDELLDKIHRLARKYGYRVQANYLRFEKIPEVAYEKAPRMRTRQGMSGETSPPEPEKEPIRVDDLIKKLRDTAFRNGYCLDWDVLMEERKDPDGRGRTPHNSGQYLLPRMRILKLPMVEIRQSEFKNNYRYYRRKWTIRPPKDPSIKYEFSDYEHGDQILVDQRSTAEAPSDYSDNRGSPLNLIGFNLSSLLDGNLKGVVSVLGLKYSTSSIPEARQYGDSQQDVKKAARYQSVRAQVIDIDKYVISKGKTAMTMEQRIAAILTQSLMNPNLGKVVDLWNNMVDLYLSRPNEWWIDNDQIRLFMGPQAPKEIYNMVHQHRGETVPHLVDQRRKERIEVIESNMSLVMSRLFGIRWIIRNPGTQWTSSINPIIGDPREWYGDYYRSFRTGHQEVETCLRLFRLRRGNYFAKMEMNLFRRLLREIIWAYSFTTLHQVSIVDRQSSLHPIPSVGSRSSLGDDNEAIGPNV